MSKRNSSFANRLSTDFVFVTAILFITALGAAAWCSHILISREATKTAQNMLDAAVREIENEIQKVEDAADGVAWIVEEHLDDPEYMYHITNRLVSRSGNVYGSAVAFPPDAFPGKHYFAPYTFKNQAKNGELTSIQLGNEDYDYFNMEWYSVAASTGRPHWSEPYIDAGGGEMEMATYSHPVIGSDGKVKAVVTADFYLKIASDILNKVHPYPHSRTVLASATGKYIVDVNSGFFGNDILSSCGSMKDDRAIEAAEDMLNGSRGIARYINDGKYSLVTYGPLKNGWTAALICDYKEVLKNSTKMHTVLFCIAMLGLALLFLLCRKIALKLTRPLTDFDKSAQQIAEGNFNTTLPDIKSEDEIRHLRDSFEHMQSSLNKYIEELKVTTSARERIESELNIANKIQMGIVPNVFPRDSRIDLHAWLKPAREVGGDFYDFMIRDDRTLYFAIGDVSGKGVPASLVMSVTIAAFRSIAKLEPDSAQMVSKINETLSEGNSEAMFVTMFVGKLNLETGKMTYCNAGHNRVVMIDPQGNASFLNQKANLAIGLTDNFKYQEESIVLAPGTRIILYTDGVTEAERDDRAQFGNERLLRWASEQKCANAWEACDDLYRNIKAFTGETPQNDDITIMTFKYKANK